MSSQKVFIDGHVGTTGLRIRDWLLGRSDLELLTPSEKARKDPAARREMIQASDIAVLCLPDEAAREASKWVEDGPVRLLDASTAHRVSEGWTYGLPELTPEQRDAIRTAKRVTNPGCYPSAFLLCLRPLLDSGLLHTEAPISIHALSGYTGGGRPLIEKWEEPENGLSGLPYEAPYALDTLHKHIPEMHVYSGLDAAPQFIPAVGPFACGMRVEIPIHAHWLSANANASQALEVLTDRYAEEPFVQVHPAPPAGAIHDRSFDPQACNDTNRIEIHAVPNPSGHLLLIATLDNLGKGAAGVAIQNLNLMLGCDEETGLVG
ncbi:MAG: N-acetyl-gamma-glutamyl-phosphate reductase [Myxococcota bacterium]|nr:N-acetyl-gamma-glutamyl-phosphate reductase [Myxococcota bacterium]